MSIIAHFVHHFRNMILLRKVLIVVSAVILVYSVYLLISKGYAWSENRGTWLVGVSAFFVALGQWLSHLHENGKLKR